VPIDPRALRYLDLPIGRPLPRRQEPNVLSVVVPDVTAEPFHFPEMTSVHCHLCGATLRRSEQFHELARPDRNDVIYLCRDETRCATRAIFDPPARRSADPHSTRVPG